MTVIHRISCDECGQKVTYGSSLEKSEDGWIEVWFGDEESLDFCDQQCLIEYFTKEDDENE